MDSLLVKVGNVTIGGEAPIVVQTMCNTHTCDIQATVEQCLRMHEAGAQIIRITVPGLNDVENIKAIKSSLLELGIDTPIVADIHFSSETAIAVAPYVEKVRINPGNFHKDHEMAKLQFARLLDVCSRTDTAVRIGLNHGSLGSYITGKYGNTAYAMAKAAMEWIDIAVERNFYRIVVSLKSSNTFVMVNAYRELKKMMSEKGVIFPLHIGVTEAGNGDSGRIKSCVGISSLLSEGIGNTIRVSLTEDPVNEIPVGRFIADRYDGTTDSSMCSVKIEGKKVCASYRSSSREHLMLDAACDWGRKLLDKQIDELEIKGCYKSPDGTDIDIESSGFGTYLVDEIMQASRRRFYKPEYIACPGCGRTMYNLQEAFEEVKARTSHLKGVVIAVMGCIVNGPGEMADADWGYVGEGNGKVSIYKGSTPLLRHIPQNEAVDRLLQLIEEQQ